MTRTSITNWLIGITALFIGLCVIPTPAYAQLVVVCPTCQSMMQGQMISQGVQQLNQKVQQLDQNNQQGHQDIVDSVETNTDVVEKAVLDSGSAIVKQLKANAAGMGKLTDALAVTNRKTMKQLQAALATVQYQQMFGYGSKEYVVDGVVHRPTAQPLTLCGSSNRAEMVGQSIENQEQVVNHTAQKVEDYNNSFADFRSRVARYDELGDRTYEADLLLSDEDGLTQEEAKKATEWIKTVTNPLPQPTLGQKRESTITGAAYSRSRKIFQAQMDAPQLALAQLKSDVTMTVPLEQDIKNKWAEINPNKVVKTDEGKVSPLFVLRTEILYRYASKEWTDRLVDLTTRGAIVELLSMKAIEMKMEYERYKLARVRTAMLAMNTARDTRKTMKRKLTRQRQAAFGLPVRPDDSNTTPTGADNG